MTSNPNSKEFDLSLSSLFDPIHGAIDTRDASGLKQPGQIAQLLNSPMVERLRKVKQLGYASHSFPSADHSRYAHALGTLHMMRVLIHRLATEGALSVSIFDDLKSLFPDVCKSATPGADEDLLAQHLLVAALLQDVGELPYGKAVNTVFTASESLRREVKDFVGFDVVDWPDKDVFTVACLHEKQHSELLLDAGLDLPLLIFLITGRAKNPDVIQRPGMQQLRHMLDGQVDADRLDYVYRDAHHTIGSTGTPRSVVESLLGYDEIGPIFADAGAVSDFLILRANLWTTVYFSPQNRFRLLLMTMLLRGIKEDALCSQEFFGNAVGGQLSLGNFLKFDDVYLTSSITDLADGSRKTNLNRKARKALEILTGGEFDYKCIWLPPPEKRTAPKIDLILPDDFFFDTYSNYQDHSLYKPNTIRINADRFQLLEDPIPLEYCSGAFGPVFKQPWSALPMPNNILLFLPRTNSGGSWANYQQAIDEGTLFDFLRRHDVLSPIDFPADTRTSSGFQGPSIFISFTWADVEIVEKIATALFRKRRRYYLLYEDFEGLGGDTKTNSAKAVQDAEAVILLVSSNYVARYKEESNGNIAIEVAEVIKERDRIKIVPLSADHYKEVEDGLPFSSMNFKGTPFVGKPLRDAPATVINEAVDKALEVIDRK